ncbi:MAG TPA: M24 family metallopeptidase [Alphaproteobacteria bacterium]|jgi:Xaa-Pro aminopeptidase
MATKQELAQMPAGVTMGTDVVVPRLPISERDRRYKNVRAEMKKSGIDVLLLPANHTRWDQMMADSRYLTTIGGYATETFTVFPLEGEVTAGLFNRSAWWKRAQDWVTDVRDCSNNWSQLVIDRLRELNFPKDGTIGISGLGWLQRAPDGIIPYSTVTKIKEAFPQARIVDCSDMMQQQRSVKSDIEVDLMRQSLKIIETMVEAVAAHAKPGVTEKELYATMVGTMLASGGEPSLLIFGTGAGIHGGQFAPTNRVLAQGDMIVGETQSNFCGYSGQIVQPISLGAQSQEYMDLLKASRDCVLAIGEGMKVGNTMGDLMDIYEKTVKGFGKADYEFSHPPMHARGLGDEFPYQTKAVDPAKYRAIPLVSGMTFVVKPRVRSSTSKKSGHIGDTITVRPNGGERLGTRKLELRVV